MTLPVELPPEGEGIIIGLEIHCQLNTRTKLFCGCSTDYRDDPPNTHVCPICLGLPGTLPRLNRRVIEFALTVAKALHCEIPEESEFSRKNYFYPDLNKAFQVTQNDHPLAIGGHLSIEGDNGEKTIRITRIHVEEDPGRLVHKGGGDRAKYTLVDYNRAGIPLIEIVTEPDLRSPKEARRFLNKLRATLEYLRVFDSEKEGSIRVDANISHRGSERVEVKNITSYKGVEKALTYEVTRQRGILRRGLRVSRETRHFVEARGVTTSSRSKEEAQDYRYFPEPDLRPVRVKGWCEQIALPELPDARRIRFMEQYGCSLDHARTLTGDLRLAGFYESVVREFHKDREAIALATTWIADILLGELNYRDASVSSLAGVPFADHLRELVMVLRNGEITEKSGIEVLRAILDQACAGGRCDPPRAWIEKLNLGKEEGDILGPAIRGVLTEHPQAVHDFLDGKGTAFNYLVGQVMKKTRGKADPAALNAALKEALKSPGK